MKKIVLSLLLMFFVCINANSQTVMRFDATFTGNPVSYTFTSTDIAYANATGGTFSTSSSNLCSGALRRTQVSTMILKLVSTSASSISIPAQSSGSSIRTLTVLETSSTLNGTYTTIPAANYTTSSTVTSSSACGTIEISGLNIPAGTFVRFTFSGNTSVSGFDVTSAATGTPTTQASNISFSNVAQTTMTASWTRGNGTLVAVFVKSGAGAITNPVNGTDYTANTTFGSGTQLGSSGYYCVYNGNGTSVNITGLTTSQAYYVQAFEYNGTAATINYQTATATNNPNNQTTAAPPSDYRSAATGNWSSAATWETYNGSAWVAAASAPNLAAANITVKTGHTITVTADVSVDELAIENGATVNVNSGVTFTVADGTGTDVTLAGTVKNTGTVTLSGSAAMAVSATGVYEDAQPATTGTITIPTATWATGSIFILSGLVGVVGTDYANLQGVRQSFSHFKINTPNLVTKLLLTRNGGTSAPFMDIAGTLTVDATGSGTGVQILSTGNNNNTLVVGKYVQNGGNVQALHNASSNATRSFTVLGDFTLTNTAIFDIANTTGTSATNITNTNIGGNLSVASTATLQRTQAAAGPISAIVFYGTSAQTASFGLTVGPLSYTVNNATGVTLLNNVTVNGILTLTSGNLITGSNKVILSSTGSISGAGATRWIQGTLQKNVATGAAVIATFEIGDAAAYKPVTVAFGNVTTAGDLFASISQTAGDHPSISGSGVNAAKSVNRFWTVTNSGLVFDNYTLTLNFASADVDAGANTANFVVKKLDGATWTSPTVGTKTITSIEATGMTSFSQFVVGEASTLPVILSNFKAEAQAEVNKLSWTTLTEVNNRGFEVERSADGKIFTSISFVGSKGDRGNSTLSLGYSFDDTKPFKGVSYYRLKQVDNDGRSVLSSIVSVSRKIAELSITRMYPNPATIELTLLINSPKKESLRMIVSDISGKIVLATDITVQLGANKQSISTSNFAPGTYMIRFVRTEGGEAMTQTFIKQ